jgi:hypothetical protein
MPSTQAAIYVYLDIETRVSSIDLLLAIPIYASLLLIIDILVYDRMQTNVSLHNTDGPTIH